MEIKLDDVNLREAIGGAILATITEEKRKQILSQAIQFLMCPQEDGGYGGRKKASPIEEAFRWAAVDVARTEAQKIVDQDPVFREKIRELLTDAASKLFERDREAMVEKVAEAFEKALVRDKY